MSSGGLQAPPTADGRRERWAGHRVQRRAVFIQAGVDAVDLHGPTPTIDEVAAVAGVSKAVLYRYFTDLNDLYGAVAGALAEDVLARVLAPMAELSTAHEVIANIVDAVTAWVERYPRRYQLIRQHSVMVAGSDSARRDAANDATTAVETIRATVADQLASLLEMFMTAFGMHLSVAEIAARALTGMVENAVHWWSGMDPHTRIARSALVEELTISAWAVIAVHLTNAGVDLGLDDPLPIPD